MAMSDRPIVPPPASDGSSPNAPTGPVFSLAELARSWAGVTGEAWESILYRLGDWAITDAFPDDAFRTGAETDTAFHKRVIFDRIRWHRDLVEKICRVEDPKERDRLQKYADIHIWTAEVAVLTRDVVLKACRAMNVAPPPMLRLVTDVSAEHAVPPECPLDWPVGVFAREAEQDKKNHRGDIMSPDEAERCTLLWAAAAEMSRNNGRSAECNWLRLMDAWWSGQLSPAGLIYFYPGLPGGREFVALERRALAGLLLGQAALEAGGVSVQDLRNWTVADYLKDPAIGDYFRPDHEGRFGLAVPTGELDHWRQKPADVRLGGGVITPTIFGALDQASGAKVPTSDAGVGVAKNAADHSMKKAGRRGRAPGSGLIDDAGLLHSMLSLLAGTDPPPSVHAAAKVMIAAGKVQYTGLPESAQRRIAGKFRTRFGAVPPPGKTWGDVWRRNLKDVGETQTK